MIDIPSLGANRTPASAQVAKPRARSLRFHAQSSRPMTCGSDRADCCDWRTRRKYLDLGPVVGATMATPTGMRFRPHTRVALG